MSTHLETPAHHQHSLNFDCKQFQRKQLSNHLKKSSIFIHSFFQWFFRSIVISFMHFTPFCRCQALHIIFPLIVLIWTSYRQRIHPPFQVGFILFIGILVASWDMFKWLITCKLSVVTIKLVLIVDLPLCHTPSFILFSSNWYFWWVINANKLFRYFDRL